MEDLWLEQAVCREALRLSLAHHRSLAIGLAGKQERGIADVFRQESDRYELVDLMKLDMAIGSGGVLSHAPSRMQAALMMLEGFGLQGITQLSVDSIFMMPHLGVFASVSPEAAYEVFEHDCLIHLGSAVVPVFPPKFSTGAALAEVLLDGRVIGRVMRDSISRLETASSGQGMLTVRPLHRAIDVGAGAGEENQRIVRLGECGIVCDGRNRPIQPALLGPQRQEAVYEALGLREGKPHV
jgi:hypothetical protein